MTTNDSLSRLSDGELLNEVKRLAAIEREATADLIRSLAEVKARGLHLAMGYSSMFGYCTQALHLSEPAAYARIAAAKVAAQFPVVRDLLIEGAITLTTITVLGRHLTDENHVALLEAARHKSKADVEMLVATLHAQPDVPSSIRKVPAPKCQVAATAPLITQVTDAVAVPQARTEEPAISPPLPPPRAVVRAIAPERYKLQVTIGAETRAKLRRAQDLLRFTNRSADEADVIDRALTLLVAQLEKVKYGRTDRPRPPPSGVEGAGWILRSLVARRPGASETRGQRTRPRSMCLRRARRPLHRDRGASVPSPHSVRRQRADDARQSRAPMSGAQSVRSGAVVRAAVRAGDRWHMGSGRRNAQREGGACPPKRARSTQREGGSLVWTE